MRGVCLYLMAALFCAHLSLAADPKPKKPGASAPVIEVVPPPPGDPAGCGTKLYTFNFERFNEVVLQDIVKHVLDEKDPAIWTEATSTNPQRYRITVNPIDQSITFTSPRGRYVVGISTDVDEKSLGQLVDGFLPRVLIKSNTASSTYGGVGVSGTAISNIGIHPNWLDPEMFKHPINGPRHMENLRGLFRAGIVADPYVHGQQKSPDVSNDTPFTESAIQQVALQEMNNLYEFSKVDDAGRPCRLGLMAPGGIGKTFMSVRFMKRIFEAERVILVVDNNDILDQAREDYAREFGLRIGNILTVYNANARRVLDPTQNILLINRTMLHRRWDEVVTWMGDKRTGFVFDEAHHLGRSTGAKEFQEIFRRFNTDPKMLANIAKQDPKKPHYVALLTSATFWHGDTDLIINPEYLGVRNLPKGVEAYGKIYGPLLYDSERVQMQREFFGQKKTRLVDVGTETDALRRGLATPELARRALLRAMGQGHLARLSHSDLHEDEIVGPNGEKASAFEVVRDIDDKKITVETTTIAYNLLEKVYEQLKGMRSHNTGDVSRALTKEEIATLAAMPNRALVMVRRTEVANAVRDALIAIARAKGDTETEIRAVHTGPGSNDREDTLAWFRDKGAYDNNKEKAMNKVLVVDQLVNEGVDVPKTNAVVLLRPFTKAEEGSIRRLIQVVTRASRTAELKTHVEIIDFSGASVFLRTILAINTQAYGGGGGGAPGGSTIINVDLKPGPVSETVTRVSIINAQPINLNPFASEIDRWMLARTPFDDPRVADASNPSPLGVQILSLLHALPKKQLVAGYSMFHHQSLAALKDNRLKELLSKVGPRLVAEYQAMISLYDRYQGHNLSGVTRDAAQLAEEIVINREAKEGWFRMLDIVRDIDFYQDREVTMSFTPLQGAGENAMGTVSRFFTWMLAIDRLPVRQVGDTAPTAGKLIEVVGRPRAGAGDSIELIVRGANAYSYLGGELGTHQLQTKSNRGVPFTNYVFLRVTPPSDSRDPLRRFIDEEHAAAEKLFRQDAQLALRRVYGVETIHRDRELPSLSIPLIKHTVDGNDLEIRLTDDVQKSLGRMLRMNHYNYLRSTIQHLIIPPLLNEVGRR